jgi:biotin transporter BioY
VKLFLKILFGFIFVFMVAMTIRTSLQQSLWDARPAFMSSPWSMATLYDAYCGFITFFCWLAWRERSIAMKIAWFALIMMLGNIAMSLYVLLQLFQLKPDEGVSRLFQQKTV